MNRVAALIVNYNMPERADALYEYLAKYVDPEKLDILLIDNGLDICDPSRHTGLCLPVNVQTTNGWLRGLEYLDKLGKDYFAYWFIITSAEFVTGNPLAPMLAAMEADPDLVGVHPTLTMNSTTSWNHLKQPGPTWMIDNIAALWRADWFNSIGRFDPELIYGWGIDLETCYKARLQGKKLLVCEDSLVKKVTDIGYSMGRMNMSAEERRELARENMDRVFTKKYGPDWRRLMYVQ